MADDNNPVTPVMPETPPVADPAPVDPPAQDPKPAEPPVGNDELEALQSQLEAMKQRVTLAEKKRLEAEKVIESEKRERKKLERAQMSDAEQLEEQRKEMEEKARQYDIQKNSLSAEKILVGANLAKEDYEEALGLIVSDNAERTEAIAQWVVDILGKQTKVAAKTEREKVLKETPQPPTGGIEEADPFVAAFKEGW